jgi:hypothetical protein
MLIHPENFVRELRTESTETSIAIATCKDGVLYILLDKTPVSLLFHEGYGALLRPGKGETEGMVEVHRVRIGDEPESLGHVEPLI